MTGPEIARRSSLGLTTVYRALKDLLLLGLITVVNRNGATRYALTEKGRVETEKLLATLSAGR